jgi:catalase (peroxidase I)
VCVCRLGGVVDGGFRAVVVSVWGSVPGSGAPTNTLGVSHICVCVCLQTSHHRGPWTNAENTFSNEYFRLLVEERWSPKLTHNGKPWDGPDQYEDATGQLMMLPADIFLLADPEFKKWVLLYAKDEDKFFKDFSAAFGKLLALGVPGSAALLKPWYQFW